MAVWSALYCLSCRWKVARVLVQNKRVRAPGTFGFVSHVEFAAIDDIVEVASSGFIEWKAFEFPLWIHYEFQ